MTKTFAIADLHGRADLLDLAIARIQAVSPDGGTIVFLGDYVDRGPQSRQVIERLMAGPKAPGWTWVCLQGNHEDMMVICLERKEQMRWWLGNGGGSTLISYGQKPGDAVEPSVVPMAHRKWLRGLPMMHVDKHRVYVHAGVSRDVPLDQQDRGVVQWLLYRGNDEGGHGERHVVHGHHQFADGPILKRGRTDLDTFAWATGRLVVGVFDDHKPGGPVSTLEIIGPPDERFAHYAAE